MLYAPKEYIFFIIKSQLGSCGEKLKFFNSLTNNELGADGPFELNSPT